MEHQHRVRARRGEQPLALIERGQAKGRRVGLEISCRVRIEGCDKRRPTPGARAFDRATDNRLMSQVEPIEIP